MTRSTGFFPPQPGARKFAAASARLIVAIAVLGGAHILVRTSTHGAAVEWDSVEYLSAAESLAAGDGLGRPRLPDEFVQFVQWPPLFPMLLALFIPFGIEPVDAARFVNALAFGLTIALAGFWLRRHCGSRVLAVAGTVAVATAVPLCDVFSYVLTEPLFILFTLLALIGLESFLNRKDAAMPPLLLAAGCAALAAVTRYVGVVGILVGVLLVLMRRDLPAAARLKFAAIHGAISSVPLALVLGRNWSVSGTLAGDRIGSGQSLLDGLGQTGDIFRAWILVSTAPEWLSISLSLSISLLLGLAGLVVLGSASSPARAVGRAILPFAAFALVYLPFLLVVAPLTIGLPIFGRLLTPIQVPILVVAVWVLDKLLRREVRGGMAQAVRWALASVLLVGGLAHIGRSVLTNHEFTARALERGYIEDRHLLPGGILGDSTYNTEYWAESEIVEWVKANPVAGHFYTNISPQLVWLAEVQSVTWIGSLESRFYVVTDDADSLIAWRCKRGGPCPDDAPGLEVVVELSDGVVLRHTHTTDEAAFFTSFAPPQVGEPFGVALSRATRRTVTDRSDWQWEKGSDAGGWTALPPSAKPTYRYTPTAPDIGHRLRARVSWTDSDGARVEAVTGPSEPVEQAAPRR